MSILAFILLFIPALFIALIKGLIVYSSARQAKALQPSYLKAFGCYIGINTLVIFYILMIGTIELNSFLIMCAIDGIVYLLVSLILIQPYAITGTKNTLTFILGGLFTNLLFMIFLMLLFVYLTDLGISSVQNAVSS